MGLVSETNTTSSGGESLLLPSRKTYRILSQKTLTPTLAIASSASTEEAGGYSHYSDWLELTSPNWTVEEYHTSSCSRTPMLYPRP